MRKVLLGVVCAVLLFVGNSIASVTESGYEGEQFDAVNSSSFTVDQHGKYQMTTKLHHSSVLYESAKGRVYFIYAGNPDKYYGVRDDYNLQFDLYKWGDGWNQSRFDVHYYKVKGKSGGGCSLWGVFSNRHYRGAGYCKVYGEQYWRYLEIEGWWIDW